nr:hypothetical protein Iba_chr07bCG12620 [Ipomoea batatas]
MKCLNFSPPSGKFLHDSNLLVLSILTLSVSSDNSCRSSLRSSSSITVDGGFTAAVETTSSSGGGSSSRSRNNSSMLSAIRSVPGRTSRQTFPTTASLDRRLKRGRTEPAENATETATMAATQQLDLTFSLQTTATSDRPELIENQTR